MKKPKVNVICPKVRIPEGVWKKLLAYIDACPMEIGGFGTIEKRDGDLVVTDVFLIEQEVSSASVEFDAGGFARGCRLGRRAIERLDGFDRALFA